MGDTKEIKPMDVECKSGLAAFERNRYFYGKLLTVRDFETEQRYLIEKQRLINRLIHGAGVVCGLKVEKVDTTKIKISPGIALDCCGREIVMPEAAKIDLSKELSSTEGGGITRWVTVRYDSCGKEPVPAYSAESSCEETCCYSRIEEGYKIEVLEEKPEECVSDDNELCTIWSNLVVNNVVGKYVDLEKKAPKWVKAGEYFNVCLTIKAKIHNMTITIEPIDIEGVEVDGNTFPFGSFDFKAAEEKKFVYKIKALVTGEQNLTEGKISAEIEGVSGGEEHNFPPLTINVVSNPDEEKNKAFVNLHQEACSPSADIPVILAKIKVTKEGDSIKNLDIDNAIVDVKGEKFDKKLVYSNPRLYQLIKCVEQQVELQEPQEQELGKDFPKIKGISWEHDREYELSNESDMEELRELMQRCTITFNRDIKKETINHKTLNGILLEYIFVKDYNDCAYVEQTLAKSNLPVCFFPEEAEDRVSFTFFPWISDIGNVGYWAVNNMIKTRTQTAYKSRVTMGITTGEVMVQNAGMRILIQLKGDFVLDENGYPLDANFLKGEFLTGNGTPGGLFESWFDVKFNYSKVDNAKKVISNKPGSTTEEVATSASLSRETAYFILEAMAKNNVIYYKEGKYYPLPDPAKTMIVYDAKYNYMRGSAKELKDNLGDEGIIAKIKSSDELTDEDKNNYEIISLRGRDITGTTKEKMRGVESKLNWSKSTGDTEIVKNPYIKDTNVFIVGGKNRRAVDVAVDGFLKNYTGA